MKSGDIYVHSGFGVRCEILPYRGLTEGAMSGTFVRFLEPVDNLYDVGDEAEVTTHFLKECLSKDDASEESSL